MSLTIKQHGEQGNTFYSIELDMQHVDYYSSLEAACVALEVLKVAVREEAAKPKQMVRWHNGDITNE